MGPPADREVAGEVTRVRWVTYLQGATGHAVVSLALLFGGGLGHRFGGWVVLGIGGLVGAALLTANGLSIHLWDVLRAYVRSVSTAPDDGDDGPERTLRGPSLSVEHRAELIAGFAQVVGVVVALVAVFGALRRVGAETGAYLLGAVLAVGNVVIVLVARLR